MAYIHNHKDPKIDEELLKDCKCTQQQMKEVLMKYGYNCEDIDEKSVKKKPYPILEEVEKILGGDRRIDYGEANASFTRIADYWNDYLYHKYHKQFEITSSDVATLMILFKIAREENKHKHDNLVDIIGYAALVDTLMENK